MKKIIVLLVISSLFLTSCSIFTEADEEIGDIKIFEVVLDFNAVDNFETIVEFPDSIGFISNQVLVVFIEEKKEILAKSTTSLSIPPIPQYDWTALPSAIDMGSESFLFSFKYSLEEITFYAEVSVNLIELYPELTRNRFRFAFVPVGVSSDYLKHKISNATDVINLN